MWTHDGYDAGAVATKPRHRKTPIQLWVFDHLSGSKALVEEIAREAGVSVDTVRGWQSRGRPSEDAIRIMERRFGEAAPTEDQPPADLSGVVAAIDRLTVAIERQTAERSEWERALIQGIAELVRGGAPSGAHAAAPLAGARR